MPYEDISPAELAKRLREDDTPLLLIDVREQVEHDIAHIDEATLLPLSRFSEWAGILEPDREIIFMCHHGIRSAQVCRYLTTQGFTRLHNLTGGIDAWSREVDPEVPLY